MELSRIAAVVLGLILVGGGLLSYAADSVMLGAGTLVIAGVALFLRGCSRNGPSWTRTPVPKELSRLVS